MVYIVVQPVGIQQLSMTAPGCVGRLGGVIVGEVILGQRVGDALPDVAGVFAQQGVNVVFGVAEYEEIAAVHALGQVNASFVGNCQKLQQRVALNVFCIHFGIARVRRHEHVIEAAHQRRARFEHLVGEHANTFFVQLMLGYAVVEEDAGLSAPANMEGAMHVSLAPAHDVAQLFPVVHLLEVQLLHGGASDDHAVEVAVFYRLEVGVEGFQMLLRGVFRLMADGAQQLNFNLKWCVGELAQNLSFSGHFGGHQIKKQKLQRTDVLADGAMLGHDKDVFALENFGCGQLVGNSDGHVKSFCRFTGALLSMFYNT